MSFAKLNLIVRLVVVFLTSIVFVALASTGTVTLASGVGSPSAVATFNSLGIYWNPPSASSSKAVEIKFREVGTTAWIQGFPLFYSPTSNQYRGSIVHLKSGTGYEVNLQLVGTSEAATLTATTWSENFPIAKTVYLPENSSDIYFAKESGTPTGYVLYTHAPGKTATIDAKNNVRNNIVVDAQYVIIRGLTLKGAQRDAIHIYSKSHDVVIEQNDISGWGRLIQPELGFGATESAILSNTALNLSRVIIQRNTIHHPRADTNSWGEPRPDLSTDSSGTHPSGPQAIYLYQTGGNHVIRYNTIYSDNTHRFNDCIGGGNNFSDQGFPHRDSDIYGNYMSHCWDNGIEAEGGNMNVRVWGNYIDDTYRGIGNRDTRLGPLYVWRNVMGTSRKFPQETTTWENDPRGSFGKTGGQDQTEYGVFYFHNTALQLTIPGVSVPTGVRDGLDGPMQDTTTRNNILQSFCTTSTCRAIRKSGSATGNDFDYDLYNASSSTGITQVHGIQGIPTYAGLVLPTPASVGGNFSLTGSSPGYDSGEIIPNFNSHLVKGAGSDIGAHEAGMPQMQFGTQAYTGGEPYTVVAGEVTVCKGDFDGDRQIGIADFQIFATNYKKSGVSCSLDLVGGNCLLDIADFAHFAVIYKSANAC